MCLGIPMLVRAVDDSHALCHGRGETRRISLALIEPPPPGSWVLVHLDTARAVLDPAEAAAIDAALDALEAAMTGTPLPDPADDPPPTLPPHLRERLQ
ncbi:HypC/HybG/HupF family hydrogenase formation chaperone [Roseospirillum parvum]|uniref:Hydrogenase expression/formation protein HypC n=1 Tax=Roseospirillum parvum TaxID=83401 RepID=A0A1G8B133_9PROT|nr:HypC/HybG/HupF family hydrogenase formation chaperone [Roseospirillum parvum]SDH26831.1 hydrogenase expression/formation protein HypC [Roseospirillum parvum]